MIDAIVAVRKPYDDQNRPAAGREGQGDARGRRRPSRRLAKEDQEKKLAAEVKANLLAAWREVVEKTPALKELENLQRAAQWRLDFVAAENSMGFHAPQEMARILGESIDLSRQAQLKASVLLGGKLPAPAVRRREVGRLVTCGDAAPGGRHRSGTTSTPRDRTPDWS